VPFNIFVEALTKHCLGEKDDWFINFCRYVYSINSNCHNMVAIY
jgi:hypothetical protein